MFQYIGKIRTVAIMSAIYIMNKPALAALPKPPSQLDIKDGNYASALITYGLTIMGYGCYLLAGLAFLFVGYEMIAAYQEAKRLEKLSHFFVWGLVGTFTLAICLGLLYAGNSLITTAPKS